MLTIGSRGSQLALWQARWIQARLEGLGVESRLEIIHTTGDKITDVALSKVGTKGLFTKEIEEALLDHSIDLAVHSLKDMPTELPAGLTLAAIPEREDPRDAIVGGRLGSLKRRRACRHQFVAASGATARHTAGFGDCGHSRQSGYASAQAGRRQVRRDRAGLGRAAAPGLGESHRGVAGSRR